MAKHEEGSGKFDKFKRAGKEIFPALGASWPYMAWGLLLALLFLEVYKFLPAGQKESLWAKLIDHIGMGFIVSTLAVFGYEWKAHLKTVIDLASNLSSQVDTAKSQVDTAKEISDGLTLAGRLLRAVELQEELQKMVGHERLRFCLDSALLSGEGREHIVQLATQLDGFVGLSSELRKNPVVESHYINFVSEIFHDLVIKPAQALVALTDGAEINTDKEHHMLVTLDSAKVGDRLLEAHMNALGEGGNKGRYWVVSDLSSWRGENLERFRSATKAAIENRGVEVVRIFDLVRHKSDFNPAEMERALRLHLEDSENWKGPDGKKCYTVKLLGGKEYLKVSRGNPKLTSDKIRRSHFGLFDYGGGLIIRVAVREADLSDLALSRSSALIREDLNIFGSLEKAAYELEADGLREKIQEVYDS